LMLVRQLFHRKQLLEDKMMMKDWIRQDSHIKLELTLIEPSSMKPKCMQSEQTWKKWRDFSGMNKRITLPIENNSLMHSICGKLLNKLNLTKRALINSILPEKTMLRQLLALNQQNNLCNKSLAHLRSH
jgi:hypothetical protein